jgi:hypothetical protein
VGGGVGVMQGAWHCCLDGVCRGRRALLPRATQRFACHVSAAAVLPRLQAAGCRCMGPAHMCACLVCCRCRSSLWPTRQGGWPWAGCRSSGCRWAALCCCPCSCCSCPGWWICCCHWRLRLVAVHRAAAGAACKQAGRQAGTPRAAPALRARMPMPAVAAMRPPLVANRRLGLGANHIPPGLGLAPLAAAPWPATSDHATAAVPPPASWPPPRAC